MKTTLTREVYSRPEVQRSIEQAKQRRERSVLHDEDDHFTVYVNVTSGTVFIIGRDATHAPAGTEAVYDTEEGEYIEE